MIATIAAREFRSLFASPLGWLLLGFTQFLLAWRFFQLVDEFQYYLQPILVRANSMLGVTDLVVMRFFGSPAVLTVLLVVVAVMAMRLLTEERRSGTLQLLFSSPVGAGEIVLGKYLGALGFVWLVLILWALMPLSLQLGTELDLGRIMAAIFGLMLLSAAFLALAIFLSTLSSQPGIAAAGTFAAGLLLMLLHHAAGMRGDAGVLEYLGSLTHYDGFLNGTVNTTDLFYFLLLTGGFLAFAVRRVDALRVQP